MEKIVGFDIGESSVKLVYFAGADLKKAVTAELPDNMVSGSRILSMDAMADFLRQTAKSNGIPLTHAALVLPSTEVFTRELVMPAMTEQQLLYNLPYEFRDYLTEEKSKYFFDYSMREVLRDESGQPTEMNLLACATLKSTVESYRAMLRRAGFRLRVLTPISTGAATSPAAGRSRWGCPIWSIWWPISAAWTSTWLTSMCARTTTMCWSRSRPVSCMAASPWRW